MALPTEYLSIKQILTTFGNCLLLCIENGMVVQSIVSLTSLLRGQLVMCFATLLPNNFLVEKMRSFCSAKASHIFTTKKRHISNSNIKNFNEMLTNDAVSFE